MYKSNIGVSKISLSTKVKGLAVLIAAGGLASWFGSKAVKEVKQANEAKIEIKAKAPERYAKMCEQSVEGTYVNWAKEAERLRDSLRIDSIAKTNYAKGLNLVKDTAKVIK